MDLELYLIENEIWFRFIEKKETVHTFDASKVTGIELHRITKNLISKTHEGKFALLIIPGDKKVDYKAAAKALNTKNVRLLSFSEAEKISGYPPGGTPSIGLKEKVQTVMDTQLLEFETYFCGGGSRDK
ncbi:MAG: YbaK/EbsC family protein, partial [Candidatus Methylarchaceae archaeon HK01M]|nr:YbaK/EbsC family protein [Candidatus Methylarchaceae archaeon HK01M]